MSWKVVRPTSWRQIFQPKVFRIVGVHAFLHTVQHDLVARRRRDPATAAAMAPEQPAEGADQKLALLEDIAALLDGAMHGEEAVDEVGIEEHVPREIGHLLDAEAVRHLIERRLGEVERPIPPALAPAHPAGVGLGRIEDEQRRGMRLLDLAAALDHRAALLGDGDDQRFVRVRRVFVGREVGTQQAEAGQMPVPPVLRRVPGIEARHARKYPGLAILANTGGTGVSTVG